MDSSSGPLYILGADKCSGLYRTAEEAEAAAKIEVSWLSEGAVLPGNQNRPPLISN